MKLFKIISGGQSGADETGLACAHALGLETGGTAPKGYRTERGVNLKLRDVYKLKESPSSAYQPRTAQNVLDADVTLWFGKIGSPGYWCTRNAIRKHGKPFYENPPAITIKYLATDFEIWNVAGNRASKNPDVVQLVRTAFGYLANELEKQYAGPLQDTEGDRFSSDGNPHTSGGSV